MTRACAHRYAVLELGPADAAEVADLDAATCEDYPRAGPVTAHAPVDEAQAAAALSNGRGFRCARRRGVARRDQHDPLWRRRVETEFTAVHPDHRGAGLGPAVKAASVLAWWADGARAFGSGGAQTDLASMAINRSVGYTVTERWLTYAPGRAGSTSCASPVRP